MTSYKETRKEIIRQMSKIQDYVEEFCKSEEFNESVSRYIVDGEIDFTDFTYCHGYDEFADLIFSDSAYKDVIFCHAYPVVDGECNYDSDMAVFIGALQIFDSNENSFNTKVAV